MGFGKRQTATLLLHIAVTNAFVLTTPRLYHSKIDTLRRASHHLECNPVNITCSVDKDSHFVDVFTVEDDLDLWAQKQCLDAMKISHTTEDENLVASFSPDLVPIQKGDDNNEIWKARLLLILAAALYGTNFSFVKVLGDVMPVSISAALRFGLASLITLPWLFQGASKDSNAARGAILAGFEVGIWNSIGYITQALGLATTAAGKSAFICSLAVVIVPLLDFLTGRRLKQREIVGVVLAVLGVGVLELGGADQHATTFTQGDLLSFVQPLAFGMGFWRMEHAMKKFPEHANRSTAAQLLAVFAASVLYGSLVGIPDISSDIPHWLHDPKILFALFWTGSITTALTVYMETLALKTLSAAETTLIFSTEPLWGAACASVIVGETLGPESLIGGALILGGCLISNLNLNDSTAIFSLSFLHSSLASIGYASQQAQTVTDLLEKDTLDVLEDVIQGASDRL